MKRHKLFSTLIIIIILEHKISILKLFLKDNLTLNFGVMAAENCFAITEINDIPKYIIFFILFHNITILPYFLS